MNILEIIKNVYEIPLYPALTLILKGHTRFFEEKLNGTNVTPSELPYILRLSVDEDVSQKEISELFGVSEAVVARTIKNLEKKGFITRKKNPENKIRKILSLTSKGHEISQEMFNIDEDWNDILFDDIEKEDLDSFNRVLKSLTVNSLKI